MAEAETPAQHTLVTSCARIAASSRFQRFILGVIVLAAVFVGLETYPGIMSRYGATLHALDNVILGIFIVEILIRLLAYGARPWRFFTDPWNVFDFLIVVACVVPFGGQHAAVARLVRLLRVFRLFSGVPRLRLIISAMVKAVPSIGYVSLLLFLLFYMYGVLGTTLFARNDPVHFSDLHTSMLSLLRTVTLEDWTDLMYIQIYGSDVYGYDTAAAKLTPEQAAAWTPQAMPILGAAYFVSFVLIGTMIVLNLFVGVVLSSLTDAQAEQAREVAMQARQGEGIHAQLARLEDKLEDVHVDVQALRDVIAKRG